jgi:peptide-methionine (S)-S-oxide reductase
MKSVGGAGEAFGQGATLERAIVSASGSLSSAQSATLASFIGQHTTALRESTDARKIEEARNALITPSRDPAATIAFRKAYAAALAKAGKGAVTTEIHELTTFWYAEAYHQQYLARNPNGYCGLGGTGVACQVGADMTVGQRD